MEKIIWHNERKKLSELSPWPRNPRKIDQIQSERLVKSFEEFGQVEPIAIGPGNEIYNGHQRLTSLIQEHGEDFEVEVRVASRFLSEKEREKLTVYLHKGAVGDWDLESLINNFDHNDLLEWGFAKEELESMNFDAPEFKEFDETIADNVQLCNCPICGHEHAAKKD